MVMENAVAFGVMEHLKRVLPEPSRESGSGPLRRIAHPLFSGAVTGVTCAVALCPSENIKTKCQCAITGPSAVADTFRDVIKRQGIVRGMFTGLDAQVK